MNKDFVSYLRDYKKVIGLLIATSLISYIAVFHSNISPPINNKTAILFISILIESAAIITVFKNKTIKNKGGVIFLLVFVFLYFSTHTLMTFKIPTSSTGEYDVKGFVCLNEASFIYKENCPLLHSKALEEASFEPDKLWENWSISIVKITLTLFWLVFIWFSSKLVATFILSERRKARRKQ